MTKDDIEHLAQVTHSLRGCVDRGDGNHRPFTEDEFVRLIDRFLWAIHSSPGTPSFDPGHFAKACIGTDGIRVFKDNE